MTYMRFGDQRYSFWSEPPWEQSRKVTIQRGPSAWPAVDPEMVEPDGIHFRRDRTTEFDDYMALAKKAGAEPLIITAYNGLYTLTDGDVTIPPREEFFAATEEWVRYANVKKKYGIRYWEIGNELWNSKEGGLQHPLDVAYDLSELVPRMKAIDPSIKILVSGNKYRWYKQILQAAEFIDYVNFSWYLPPTPGGYDNFRHRENLLATSPVFTDLTKAIDELPPEQRDRIGIIVTEFNAIDWDDKWPNTNDLGHALCVFQQAGEALSHPRIHLAIQWTTQWAWPMWSEKADDASVYNAVRNDGSLAANGVALSIWGQNLLDEFVRTTSSHPQVRAWATRSADGRQLNLFVLNKDLNAHPLLLNDVDLKFSLKDVKVFTGSSIQDQHPNFTSLPPAEKIMLQPASVTLLRLNRAP
jgi:alpha-N-arabinofuranosidase